MPDPSPDVADPNEDLQQLQQRFLVALAAKDKGDIDAAEDELRAVLRVEPRLPEPRMELARILLDTGRPLMAARQLYLSLAFRERGPYWDAPPEIADRLVFFELDL